MIPPGTISRAKPTESGADFAALRAEAIYRVQQMAGDVWTDYNYSDPGVTIIEQLCYALTEMPYRASFPVADLLCEPGTDKLRLRRQGLFPAPSILPCNPVTANDFRRVVLDRVADVANVWFTPIDDGPDRPPTGLYDVAILPSFEADRSDGRDEGLIQRVRRCYTAHRALGEDIGTITILRPIETVVHARIEIENNADPSDTLAAALFALGLTMAPEPKRQSLAEKHKEDPASTDIFSGPLMLRGFIGDDQLQPLPQTFTADQLIEVLAAVGGVLTVDHLSVEIDRHGPRYTGTTAITIPDDTILHLRTLPRDGRFTISMLRNRTRCEPNSGQVRRRLAEHWKSRRRTYSLRTEYTEHYGLPAARFSDLRAYVSVQDQFPLVYGIGSGGLPPSATPARRAQARQLKGYLMPFDQMLADSFSQLAFLRDLFSIEAGGDTTYAWQSLRDIVPDVNRMQLLHTGYEKDLAHLVAETDPVATRREAILDLLLSFYALELTLPEQPAADVQAVAARTEASIAAKQALLRRAATTTRDRGRGVDYLRPVSTRRMAGAELVSCIELDMLDHGSGEGRSARPDGEAEPMLVDDPEDASFGHMLPSDLWSSVERMFREIDDVDDETALADDMSLLAGQRIAPGLLAGLREPDGYRIGGDDESKSLILVCRDAEGRWWLIAEFDDERQARRAARALRGAAGRHHRRTRGKHLYFVDWVLLRHAIASGETDASRYHLRVSAIVATTADERDAPGWEAQATAILRGNVPAHIALDCLFLGPRDMDRFDHLYEHWLHALRWGPPSALAETSRRLEYFLRRHGPRTQPEGGQRPAAPVEDPTSPISPGGDIAPAPPTPVQPPVPQYPDQPPSPLPPPPDQQQDQPPEVADDDEPGFWSRLLGWLVALVGLLFWWRRRPPEEDPPSPASPLPLPPLPVPPSIRPPSAPVVQAPPGALGFDANATLTGTTAAAFRNAGFSFVVRYLSRSIPAAMWDLGANETATIRRAGLAIMAVQHVKSAPWIPDKTLGAQYGKAAGYNAVSAGLPAGVSIWLDLEGIQTGTPPDDVIAYCQAWFSAVATAGYLPGLYVGADCGLTSAQLGDLDFQHYWRSGSHVPEVSGHGYCMTQTIAGDTLADVAYDRDLIQADDRNATPMWFAPSSAEGA